MSKFSTIAIACDHAGPTLKAAIIEWLKGEGVSVKDFGTNDTESVDYPDFAQKVTASITSGESEAGILICGTGIGMSIAANRQKGIRAALCHNRETARLAREHNNANVLCLGARVVDEATAHICIDTFLNTDFAGGRHEKRIEKLS